MSCGLVNTIQGDECIGDSRDKINLNFTSLETAVCNLSSNTIYANNTDTIDLAFTPSTRNISGIVKTNSLDSTHLKNNSVGTSELSAQAVTTDKIAPGAVRYSQLATWQELSASPTLSAEAVQPRVAKAWVTFRGTGTVAISSAFNVSSVTDNGVGTYTVNFIQPMNNLGYAIAGAVEDITPNDAGGILYTSTTTTRTLSSIQIKSTGVQGPPWAFDSNSISLIVFGY